MASAESGRGTVDPPYPGEDSPRRSLLFTVRVWPEYRSGGRTEWRGQVEQVMDHETRFFRDWSTLVDFLELKLSKLQEEAP